MPRGVPPGRAARLWLLARLDVARRAADLLERKERLLRSEADRLGQLATRTARRWATSCRDAERWTGRAVLVGGREALRHTDPPASAELGWRNTMGLSYPDEAACRLSGDPPVASANPALGPAVTANRRALEAAVEHAAADYALARVTAELATTRRRRRALTERWIPELERTLASVESRLEELEREEHVRVRWALRHAGPGGT